MIIIKVFSLFQSTLSRRERHYEEALKLGLVNISIHALTKRATWSQSAYPDLIGRDFNPRSHEESDEESQMVHRALDNFNPRSHEESDPSTAQAAYSSDRFQSTLSRRERQALLLVKLFPQIFQSTLSRRERPTTPAT